MTNDDLYVPSNLDAIIALNDRMRRDWNTFPNSRVFVTQGICCLSPRDQEEISRKVRNYDAFDQDDDIYNEHDFGSFEHAGHTVFWKIDCYDLDMTCVSSDPADIHCTTRVLTILLADEW